MDLLFRINLLWSIILYIFGSYKQFSIRSYYSFVGRGCKHFDRTYVNFGIKRAFDDKCYCWGNGHYHRNLHYEFCGKIGGYMFQNILMKMCKHWLPLCMLELMNFLRGRFLYLKKGKELFAYAERNEEFKVCYVQNVIKIQQYFFIKK